MPHILPGSLASAAYGACGLLSSGVTGSSGARLSGPTAILAGGVGLVALLAVWLAWRATRAATQPNRSPALPPTATVPTMATLTARTPLPAAVPVGAPTGERAEQRELVSA